MYLIKKSKSNIVYTAALLATAVMLFSCGKNAPGPTPAPPPPSFTAMVNGVSRNFDITSVAYGSNMLTMNLTSKSKVDTCLIKIVVTAKQYGTYTLASNKSPNYASMTIKDKGDTVYYTDNTWLGHVQLTNLQTTDSHVASGNFSFKCNETSPIAGSAIDSASGSFSGLTW